MSHELNGDLLCIVDTETTGLDPTTDSLIEVAAVLWSIGDKCVVTAWSDVIDREAGNPIEDVNHIASGVLRYHGSGMTTVLGTLRQMSVRADVMVAHNAAFDRDFLKENGFTFPSWLCTKEDFEWPIPSASLSLVNLAVTHGVGVVQAHRALTDCMLIARLLERVAEMGHDIPTMIQRAMRPKKSYQALVSYDDREKAKAAGFRWEATAKQWVRRMAPEDTLKLDFKVRDLSI